MTWPTDRHASGCGLRAVPRLASGHDLRGEPRRAEGRPGPRRPRGTPGARGVAARGWILLLPLLALTTRVLAQAGYVIGEVTSVDPEASTLTARVDTGDLVVVTIPQGAALLRAKPGATNLAGASPATLREIVVGDRVMLRGALSQDRKTLEARQVVAMSRDAIAQKQDAERAEWRQRGILGIVTALDPARGEITLRPPRSRGTVPLVVSTAGRPVVFRRYAPDSVKFSDARPSGLAEVQLGDEVRALGERSPAGEVFLAEQVVFGSFRLVSGTIRRVDAGKSEVTLSADEPKGSITVALGPDARLRRLTPEIAVRLAGRRDREGEAPGPPRAPRGAGAAPEDLLERLPAVSLAELKAGDRILVSSTKGADPQRLNAIALVAGLEALAPPPAAGRAARGPDLGLPPELLDLGMSLQ